MRSQTVSYMAVSNENDHISVIGISAVTTPRVSDAPVMAIRVTAGPPALHDDCPAPVHFA